MLAFCVLLQELVFQTIVKQPAVVQKPPPPPPVTQQQSTAA
jgi:hypothetical protein